MLSVLIKRSGAFPFAFNPFFSSGKRGCRLLTDKLTDYRSYQQLASILTHREKIGDFGTEDIYAEVFGSTSYEESGATFILTSSVSSKKYAGLFDGWNDKAERNYLLCTQVGCSERGDAENIINALIGSVSNLAVSDGQTDLGWKTDTSAWFSSRPVPSLKRNSLFAELLYRIVYRDSLRIGICRNCGAPFLQSGIGSLNEVCSQACRMAQRRRKGLVLQESFWEFSKLTGRNIGSSYTKDDARVRLTVLQNRRPTWIETGFEAFTSSLKSSLQGRLQSFNRSNLTTQNDLHGRKQESND